jgi:hypothetical protein
LAFDWVAILPQQNETQKYAWQAGFVIDDGRLSHYGQTRIEMAALPARSGLI